MQVWLFLMPMNVVGSLWFYGNLNMFTYKCLGGFLCTILKKL